MLHHRCSSHHTLPSSMLHHRCSPHFPLPCYHAITRSFPSSPIPPPHIMPTAMPPSRSLSRRSSPSMRGTQARSDVSSAAASYSCTCASTRGRKCGCHVSSHVPFRHRHPGTAATTRNRTHHRCQTSSSTGRAKAAARLSTGGCTFIPN